MLDTNILVHLIRGDQMGLLLDASYDLLRSESPNAICIVTNGEIRSLANQLSWGIARLDTMYSLLDLLSNIPLGSTEVLETYARMDTYCRKSGLSLGKNDLWIAATAVATGYDLLTLDNDFDPLDGVFLNVLKLPQ